MGVYWTAYLVLGYKIEKEDKELIDYVSDIFHNAIDTQDKKLKSDMVLDCMCGDYVVIGKELSSQYQFDKEEISKVKLPDKDMYKRVRENLKEDFDLDLGDPEILFFVHRE